MEKRITRRSLRTNQSLDKNEEEEKPIINNAIDEPKIEIETDVAPVVAEIIKTEPLTNEENDKSNARRTRSNRISLNVNQKPIIKQPITNNEQSVVLNETNNDFETLSSKPAASAAIPTPVLNNSISIIKTRSRNRLNSGNYLNSSVSNESFLTHETRKRHLSQTDTMNDSLNNEDSNSNSSSIISSTIATNALATIINHNNTNEIHNSKKLKLYSSHQQQQHINKISVGTKTKISS